MSGLLEIRNLTVKYPTRFGTLTAIEAIDLDIAEGEIHGLVGESGAGKTTIGAAINGLISSPGYIADGRVRLQGRELQDLPDADYHKLRGAEISMIFQDPQTSLNPLLTIEDQLVETIRQHRDVDYTVARTEAVKLLDDMDIPDVENRITQYPHQFSGGMRQRVVIALALCTNPKLIIADEPTTALDVAVQKQILQLIKKLANERGVGFLLITHDIGVIAQVADKVTVLRGGKLIETGPTIDVLANPQTDYTKSLMAAVPRLETRIERFTNIAQEKVKQAGVPLHWKVAGASADFASNWLLGTGEEQAKSQGNVLSVRELGVTFYGEKPFAFVKAKGFDALRNISFDVARGRTLGIIGESGSGKSTLAKAIVGLVPTSSGAMLFNGSPLPPASKRKRGHPSRRQIQMIFQDPYSSLNNRQKIGDIIAAPIRHFGLEKDNKTIDRIVASVLELVDMPHWAMMRYPHQFSGGQRQRIAVARALVARPEFLICDEPTSALDVSIQAQILNLLKDLQAAFGLSILFISHNLAVVRQMSDDLILLKGGELVEQAKADDFFAAPQSVYGQQLLRETPSLAMIERGE